MTESTSPPARPGRGKPRTGLLIFGLLMVLGGSIGLFGNEWRSASEVATLSAGKRSVVSVALDRVARDVGDRLVHANGVARPGGPVEDPLFPISHAALRLDRVVEMYQWREVDEGSGDNRNTRYERVWAEGRFASERFRNRAGHTNPPAPPVQSARFHPTEVTLGAYGVAAELVELLPANMPVTVPRGAEVFVRGLALTGTGAAFLSGDANRPSIGDVRVRFQSVPPGETSVLGGLNGSVLRPWVAPNGGRIAMVEPGLLDAPAMLGAAYRANTLQTWAIRIAGTLAIFIGCSILLRQLARRMQRLADVRAGAATSFALTVAVAWALAVVAVAWVVFRPLTSLMLVLASTGIFVLLNVVHAKLSRRNAATQSRPS